MAQVVKVTDAQTGEPLAWVSIFSKERNAQAVTDESGSADISAMRGAADIEFQLLGYAPQRRSYFELERSNYRVALEPWTLSLQQVVVSASRWRQSRRQYPTTSCRFRRTMCHWSIRRRLPTCWVARGACSFRKASKEVVAP